MTKAVYLGEPFAGVFKRGLAIGHSAIKDDKMRFRFWGETFEFPSIKVHHLATWNGYFYEIPIDELRKLEAEATT